MKSFSWILLLGAIAVGGYSASVQAQTSPDTEESDVVDLQTVTCRDLLASDGEDRKDLLVFMHGYMSGATGTMTVDGSVIAETTDSIVDACIDNPERQLLSVFEEVR